MGFASEVAKSCGTFNVSFTTSGAYGTAAYVSLWLNLSHLLAIDGVFKMAGFDDSCCFFSVNQPHPFMKSINANDPWSKVLKSLLSPSFDSLGFLCNSVEEIEPMGQSNQESHKTSCLVHWSFASTMYARERPPIGYDIKGEFRSEWLPKGYQERVEMSQKVLESLSRGVPIISWPLAGEQAFNLKMLMEEMEVCVGLTKEVDSVVAKEDVMKVVNIVLSKSGKGKEMKEKANEIGMCIRGAVKEESDYKGSSVKALDDFIATLLNKMAPTKRKDKSTTTSSRDSKKAKMQTSLDDLVEHATTISKTANESPSHSHNEKQSSNQEKGLEAKASQVEEEMSEDDQEENSKEAKKELKIYSLKRDNVVEMDCGCD
ncbi:hypothetical protein RND71_026146 [Anisodus tanguticus]|uniref:Uncharacterized protein n=1 Tax=Anisodus tanguticus TaxID=243964 RepID=A0AAE1RMX4_9SOLA|nr:hypothetical protein RND71_026146 [Anisodus tanguticus]